MGGKTVKLGFAERKKGYPKEDHSRRTDSDGKELLKGLALTGVLLSGIAAASLKAAEHFEKKDEE